MTALLWFLLLVSLVLFAAAALVVITGIYLRGDDDAAARHRYVALLCEAVLQPRDETNGLLPFVDGNDSPEMLGRLMCDFRRLVAEYSFRKVREIVAAASVEEFYLGRFLRGGGYADVESLSVLGSIPLSAEGMDELLWRRTDNRLAGLQAAMLRLNSEPERMLDIIASHDDLTPHMAARIAQHAAPDRLRLDWAACLASRNDNLRLLGLSLAGLYRIDAAGESVCELFADSSPRVAHAALHCAVLLNLPLDDGLERHVRSLSEQQRRAAYRMFVRNGYSRRVMRRFEVYERGLDSGLDEYIGNGLNVRSRILGREKVEV